MGSGRKRNRTGNGTHGNSATTGTQLRPPACVEEEEEVELWESNFGCANMRDQWVVYPGQLPGDGGGGGTGASSANAIDLTMHDARVQADALCAPMSMF